jgi:hypothetical protein
VDKIKADIRHRQLSEKPWAVNDFMVSINQLVQQAIGYGVRLEPGIQTCEETLTLAKGSCRDSAWLLVQIFRHLGYAARFASGYLVQLTADVKALDGPSGPEKDFTDMHGPKFIFPALVGLVSIPLPVYWQLKAIFRSLARPIRFLPHLSPVLPVNAK